LRPTDPISLEEKSSSNTFLAVGAGVGYCDTVGGKESVAAMVGEALVVGFALGETVGIVEMVGTTLGIVDTDGSALG